MIYCLDHADLDICQCHVRAGRVVSSTLGKLADLWGGDEMQPVDGQGHLYSTVHYGLNRRWYTREFYGLFGF
jgi:hypothetical protein